MIWKVFRFYFFLYFVPSTVILLEMIGPHFGIHLETYPKQYGVLVNTLYVFGTLYCIVIIANEFFSRSEHVQYFGDKRKYSFIWTWYLAVPVVIAFHMGNYGAALIQSLIFIILEALRRKHNRMWDEDENARIIQKARDAKAERVEIDQ